MKKYARAFFAATLAAAAALTPHAPASAQDDWQKRTFQEWTKEDAEKILTDSPWAQTKGVQGEMVDPTGGDAISGATSSPRALTLRLRSALTVRLAILRLRQLRAKYDRMSDTEKADFNIKNKELVQCQTCEDNYVVALSPPPGRDKGIPVVLNSMSLKAVQNYVKLMDERGQSRELIHFEPSKVIGGEALFFFSRYDAKGAPLLTPESKKLVVTFSSEIMGDAVSTFSRFEFDVTKMILGGKVIF